MTFARRLLLVGSDHRFSQTVQTHLHKTFLLTAPVVRVEDVPELVTRETDGVLLFLAADPADADRIEAAVRELRLQQLPPKLAVLETEEFAADPAARLVGAAPRRPVRLAGQPPRAERLGPPGRHPRGRRSPTPPPRPCRSDSAAS